jgi:hypothetical protein
VSNLILVALPEECLEAVSKAIDIACHVSKDLTDEEIEKVFSEILGIEPAPSSVFDFARAILKKASEQ